VPRFMLRMLGVYHAAPCCRSALETWVKNARARYGDPAFVMVEANFDVWDEIEHQRLILCEGLCAAWPAGHHKLAHELAGALFFEADGHRSALPGVPTIGLDDGRLTVSDEGTSIPLLDSVRMSATNKLTEYTRWIDGSNDPILDREKVLRAIRDRGEREEDEAKKSGKLLIPEQWSDGRTLPRDRVWDERIAAEIDRSTAGATWGLVVVGARHTDTGVESVRRFLANAGRKISVIPLWKHNPL
jgi:hypothetical protein